MPQKCENKLKQWDGHKPRKLQFQSILNMENVYALQTLRINRSRPRTRLHVPLGTLWPNSSDTHQAVEMQKENSNKMYTPF